MDDYKERRIKQMEFWKGTNGKHPGDPTKLAKALVEIASLPEARVVNINNPFLNLHKWK